MELEGLDAQLGAVEDADDLGEPGFASGELDGDARVGAAAQLAEPGEQLGQAVAVAGRGRRHLDARAADVGLQLGRCPLGDDLAVVDDPDPIGEDVGLLEVLGGEEHRHALVPGQPGDLLPQRGAALRVKPGRGLVEEEDLRRVHEREREVEAALHPA